MGPTESPDVGERLARALLDYGLTSNASLVPQLAELYQRSMASMNTEARLGMMVELSSLVVQRKLSANVLMPFVFSDTAHAVISSATLSTASLWPGSEDDPVLGVRKLAAQAREHAERGDELRAVAILSGLLLLGDRRAIDLLRNCWRWLSFEGRGRLSHLDSGYLHAPLIDWLIDWLADCEQGDFGVVAAALIRMSQRALGQQVRETERVLPAWLAVDGQSVRIIREWTFAEFGEWIRPRLEEIARHESDPRLIPGLMEAWHLGLPTLVLGAAPRVSSGTRELLTEVPASALEHSQDIPSIVVDEEELLSMGGDLLLCWGIFNPNGPTLSCFGRLRTGRPDVNFLFYRMLNPFRQDSFVVGTLVDPELADGAAIARLLHFKFKENWIANRGTSPVFLFGRGAPTLIISPWDNSAFSDAVPQFFKDSPAIRGSNLAQAVEYMRKDPMRPWERAAAERDKALASALASLRGNDPQTSSASGQPSSLATVEVWYEMVTARDHVTVGLACFSDAWNYSVEHCGSPELQASAYSMHRLNAFLAAFEYPILEEIARNLEQGLE